MKTIEFCEQGEAAVGEIEIISLKSAASRESILRKKGDCGF